MRCLHCGKELALFKRLTKGEFCSDEHRQAYQREYSQMALSRLLQAKPPVEREQPEETQTSEETRQGADRSGRLLTGSTLGLERALPAPVSERPVRAGAQKHLPAPEGARTPRESNNAKPAAAPEKSNPTNHLANHPENHDDRGVDMSLAHDLVSKGDERGTKRGNSNTEPELSIFRNPPEKAVPLEKPAAKSSAPSKAADSAAPVSAKTAASGPVHAPAPIAEVLPELPKAVNVECEPKKIEPEPRFVTLNSVANSTPSFETHNSELEGEPQSAQARLLQYPVTVYQTGSLVGTLPVAESMNLPQNQAWQRIPPQGLIALPALLEPGLEQFPCHPRVIHLEISLQIAWKPRPFLEPLKISVQPRRRRTEGELWRNRECQVDRLPVVVGELTRLRLPTAEVDDAELRRSRRTRAGTGAGTRTVAEQRRESREEAAVPAAGSVGGASPTNDRLGRNVLTGGSSAGGPWDRPGSPVPAAPVDDRASGVSGEKPEDSTPPGSAPPRAIQIAWPMADRRARLGDRRAASGDRRKQPRRVSLLTVNPDAVNAVGARLDFGPGAQGRLTKPAAGEQPAEGYFTETGIAEDAKGAKRGPDKGAENPDAGETGALPALAEALSGPDGYAAESDPNLFTAPPFTQIDFNKARPDRVLAKIKSLLGPVPIILLLLTSGPPASKPSFSGSSIAEMSSNTPGWSATTELANVELAHSGLVTTGLAVSGLMAGTSLPGRVQLVDRIMGE
jgi:hypothetical protein